MNENAGWTDDEIRRIDAGWDGIDRTAPDALPPDAVEAAAEAMYRRKYAHSRTAMMPWESTDAGSREYERNGATAALFAALPAWEAWLREKWEADAMRCDCTALTCVHCRDRAREGGTP